jgi:hypothetical protein
MAALKIKIGLVTGAQKNLCINQTYVVLAVKDMLDTLSAWRPEFAG